MQAGSRTHFAWVMTSRRGDGGVHFYIGQVRVAAIRYLRGTSGVYLSCDGVSSSRHDSVSDAMREMHRLLRAPPLEGSEEVKP